MEIEKMVKKTAAWVLIVLVVLASVLTLASCESELGGNSQQGSSTAQEEESGGDSDSSGKSESSTGSEKKSGKSKKSSKKKIKKNGTYDQKDDVAEYLIIYKKLPKNYITKKKAKKLGWQGGSVEKVAPGKAIGGDYYGNYEKKLPKKKGRKYRECDIDTLGKGKRGPKRLIYSNDGLIYYTGNHYKSFEKVAG